MKLHTDGTIEGTPEEVAAYKLYLPQNVANAVVEQRPDLKKVVVVNPFFKIPKEQPYDPYDSMEQQHRLGRVYTQSQDGSQGTWPPQLKFRY